MKLRSTNLTTCRGFTHMAMRKAMQLGQCGKFTRTKVAPDSQKSHPWSAYADYWMRIFYPWSGSHEPCVEATFRLFRWEPHIRLSGHVARPTFGPHCDNFMRWWWIFVIRKFLTTQTYVSSSNKACNEARVSIIRGTRSISQLKITRKSISIMKI